MEGRLVSSHSKIDRMATALQSGKPLTTAQLQARAKFDRATSVAAAVYTLRTEGFKIRTIRRSGKPAQYQQVS